MPYQDPERRRAYGREWMKRNAEKAREGMRRWRRRHPEEHLAEVGAYYQRNRERVDARTAAYRRRRPEVRVRLANEKLRSSDFEVVDCWPAGKIHSVR